MTQNRRLFFRFLTGLLLFGFNGIVASHIALESGQIVLLRTLLGSVSLLAFFFLSGHRFSFAGRGRGLRSGRTEQHSDSCRRPDCCHSIWSQQS